MSETKKQGQKAGRAAGAGIQNAFLAAAASTPPSSAIHFQLLYSGRSKSSKTAAGWRCSKIRARILKDALIYRPRRMRLGEG